MVGLGPGGSAVWRERCMEGSSNCGSLVLWEYRKD